MLERLLTEQSNPATARLDALPTEDLLAALNAEDARVAAAVAAEIPTIARALDAMLGSAPVVPITSARRRRTKAAEK